MNRFFMGYPDAPQCGIKLAVLARSAILLFLEQPFFSKEDLDAIEHWSKEAHRMIAIGASFSPTLPDEFPLIACVRAVAIALQHEAGKALADILIADDLGDKAIVRHWGLQPAWFLWANAQLELLRQSNALPDPIVFCADGLTVRRNNAGDGQFSLTITFKREESSGVIQIEESAYGLAVRCNGIEGDAPVALLDLYPQSPASLAEQTGELPQMQIIFHDPVATEDPVGRVRFFAARTRVDFESGVRQQARLDKPTTLADYEFGYPG